MIVDTQAAFSAAQSALAPFLELREADGHTVPTKVNVVEAGIGSISVIVSDLPHTIDDLARSEQAMLQEIERRNPFLLSLIDLVRS